MPEAIFLSTGAMPQVRWKGGYPKEHVRIGVCWGVFYFVVQTMFRGTFQVSNVSHHDMPERAGNIFREAGTNSSWVRSPRTLRRLYKP